ncbi:MAG TPA: hypothetical protein VGC41_04215, partial [Kofleriaceae bacterium]
MGESTIAFVDLERAFAAGDSQLGSLIVRYNEQSDPEPGIDETAVPETTEDPPDVDVPPGAVTMSTLQQDLRSGLRGKNRTEKKLARVEAFARAETSMFAPPRLRLGKLLLAMYEQNTPVMRGALLEVFANATPRWGVWQGMKTIYKLSEERADAAMFGALASRFDQVKRGGEIGLGTFVYLRKRAWRFLKSLGKALPDAYATFCVEVLRNYPAAYGKYDGGMVAGRIFNNSPWTFSPPEGDRIAQRRPYP